MYENKIKLLFKKPKQIVLVFNKIAYLCMYAYIYLLYLAVYTTHFFFYVQKIILYLIRLWVSFGLLVPGVLVLQWP